MCDGVQRCSCAEACRANRRELSDLQPLSACMGAPLRRQSIPQYLGPPPVDSNTTSASPSQPTEPSPSPSSTLNFPPLASRTRLSLLLPQTRS